MNRFAVTSAILALLPVLYGCGGSPSSAERRARPGFAFITNGVTDFWEIAEAGARAAGRDLAVDVQAVMPNSMTEQTRKIEDLLVRGTDGIAISPIDPENQVEIINRAADETILITHDSDAPQTNRRMYIGMDNYVAGMMCGRTLREALPDGGKVMIFIGRLDQDNAKRRRQGFIDGLLGRAPDAARNDPPSGILTSDDQKYTILGTMTDNFDRAKGKANVEDALTRQPDITAMVGLFDYNPPLILEALERSGKLRQVKVMGFDEHFVTLQGIKDGTVVGTVVQDPYQYGYQSIQTLLELYKGNETVIPASRIVDIPARVINTSNVDEFQEAIKKRLAKN
jgi:ribose transport system substrate-binding protein